MKNTGYPSSIKPWKKYYSNFDENFVAPEKSMFMLLEENAKLREDNIAINYLNFKMTFKKYIEKIKHEANCLKSLGVKKGDIVTEKQLIATPGEGLSVALHSPVNGKVTAVGKTAIIIEKQ